MGRKIEFRYKQRHLGVKKEYGLGGKIRLSAAGAAILIILSTGFAWAEYKKPNILLVEEESYLTDAFTREGLSFGPCSLWYFFPNCRCCSV
jgi:hypothetical protein